MDIQIPLADIDLGPEEEAAVVDVIRRRWLTMGAVTQEFEREFAQVVGSKYAFAVSNCTDALHLACLALEIGPGDEVIVPSLTFVATANSALYTGAEVRFADICSTTDLTISPAEIQKSISAYTKAIIVVHYGGYPCHMQEIMEIAQSFGLAVIEDAAHAPGAFLDNRSLGTWGDVGCFSFFSNKNLATGEGGMLVTDREDVAEKIRYLRSHGMTSLTWDRHQGHAYTYDVVALGHNYRIDEIRSAIGLVQLGKLEKNNARRKAITEYYRKTLIELDTGIEIPFLNSPGLSAYHIFPILLPENVDRSVFMESLRNSHIQTSIHYPPIHKFSYYQQRYPGINLPLTETAARREVTLPLYPGLSEIEIQYVVSAVEKSLNEAVAMV
jgi:dTDP-4-amino-4,6-dideoxygalactose transaminase